MERLVDRGELSPDDVNAAVAASQAHGLPFAEVLVLQGKLTEKRLLAELVSDFRVATITSGEIWKSKIDSDLLDRIPVRKAEELCALPLRFDAKKGTLAVAVPTSDEARMDRLREVATAPQLTPVLATTFAIRAGIKRFYYADHDAFHSLSQLAFGISRGAEQCPSCGAARPATALQCPKCGLLGNAGAARSEESPREVSIVRALLSPAEAVTSPEGVPKVSNAGEGRTTQFSPASLLEGNVVPALVAGLDAALQTLQPFEAYVASFIDGVLTVEEIAKAAKMSSIEICAILRALADQNVVSLGEVVELGPEPRTEQTSGAVRAAVMQSAGASEITEPPVAPLPAHQTLPGSGPITGRTTVERGSVLQRAVVLERQGKVDEAIAVLEQGLEESKSAVLYNKLALILLAQRKDAERAERLLREAIEIDPENPAYQANLFSVMAMAREAKPGVRGLLTKLWR